MKEWRCGNCARGSYSEENIIMKICLCGEAMKEVGVEE